MINLKSNVSEFGFFKGFAKTRGRLITTVVIATTVTLVGAWFITSYILETSTSVGINLGLITLIMMAVVVTAYLQTLLMGDIFFAGPWRETIILGEKSDNVVVKDHNAEFMIILMVGLIAMALTIDMMAGGFFETYHTAGFFRARSRSADPEERRDALRKLSDVTSMDLWTNGELRNLVIQQLEDPDDDVREYAVWNVGRMDIPGGQDPLLDILVNDTNPKVRAEAAIAIGKLGVTPKTREALEARLSSDDPTELIGVLRGLALMKTPMASKKVLPLVAHADQNVALHAFWVLRNGADPSIRNFIREQLTKEQPAIIQCALLDTLKMVANDEDVTWARKRFDDLPAETACDPLIWEERSEKQYYVSYSDSLRVKHLKIVANASGVKHEGWFRRIVADPTQPWRVREVANEIIAQIEKAGNR